MRFKKIYIEITNNCNLNCSFCPPGKRKKQIMSVEDFEYIVKMIVPYTKTIYLHVKGEPLLHPNLDSILEITDKYSLRVNITTNGTMLHKNIKIINKHLSVSKLNISLHAEYNNDSIYEQIFESITKLRKDIKTIYRLWTLSDNTLDDKSLLIVKKMKAYYNLSTELVNKIKTDNNIKILSTVYVDKDAKFEWPTESDKNQEGFCMALKTQIAILVDGTIVPCCLDEDAKVNLGNIFETEFADILKTEKLVNLKKSFGDRKPSEKLCQSCTYKNRFNTQR